MKNVKLAIPHRAASTAGPENVIEAESVPLVGAMVAMVGMFAAVHPAGGAKWPSNSASAAR